MRIAGAFIVLLSGCTNLLDYQRVEINGEEVDRGLSRQYVEIVNPDSFSVKTIGSQRYQFTVDFLPPVPGWLKSSAGMNDFVNVLMSDEWKITHSYGGYYIMQSGEYNDRQCRKQLYGDFINIFGSCRRRNDYGIWVEKVSFTVIGWANLPGPQRIFGNRRVELVLPGYYIERDSNSLYQWPNLIAR